LPSLSGNRTNRSLGTRLTRGCGPAPMRGHGGYSRLPDFSAPLGSPPRKMTERLGALADGEGNVALIFEDRPMDEARPKEMRDG
jgi:hypothetical protein